MIIYVGGISGVGKTTIIREVISKAQEECIRMETTKGIELLCDLTGVKTMKDLRSVPEETKRSFRSEMYEQIYETDRKDITTIRIADGHFCLFDEKTENCVPCFIQPQNREQLLFFLVIIANPKSILRMITNDKLSRPDRSLDIDFIERNQEIEVKTAFNQAQEIGIPIEILENKEGDIMETVSAFIDLIKNYSVVLPDKVKHSVRA